jgi:transposase-like protein
VIVLAVRWYLRFGLSYRDVEELLAERGIQVDHVTIYRWVQRFTPLLAEPRGPAAMPLVTAFDQAISATKVTPIEVTTDQAPVYPAVLDELLPAAWHRTDRYANNRVECDHGRLKARLRPMRGLKQDRSARVIIVGHGFVQNLRCGYYDLVNEEPVNQRVAVAFDELALAI